MINCTKEKDLAAKQERDINDSKLSKASSSSRQWGGFKNPRIVRVPRSFGGKDRHSKVTTIRGLRDRRIRLSVPTAIQLYDLQDRLGLSQPSKVVDWLLDATKNDIDKLPPLQIPQGSFGQYFNNQPIVDPHDLNTFFNTNAGFARNGGVAINENDVMGSDHTLRGKSKEIATDNVIDNKWITRHEQENQVNYMSAQNFFPLANHPFPSLLNPYYHWEPPNISLSQFGTQLLTSQTDQTNSQSTPLASSSMATPPSQLFFCPPAAAPSLFPSYMATSTEHDQRQFNHFQLLSSSSQHILPNSLMPPLHFINPFNVHPKAHSHNTEEGQQSKGKGNRS